MHEKESKVINVLGTQYEIREATEDEEPVLKDAEGICDESVKLIIIDSMIPDPSSIIELRNLNQHKMKVLRHEIIHAFLFESGLAECSPFAKNEEMVDWIAKQFPKLLKAFRDSGCIDM